MTTDELPIATERLILRRFEDGDLEKFVDYRCDPQVARYQSWSEFGSSHVSPLNRADPILI